MNSFRPLFLRIDELSKQKKGVTIGIDGNSASGKTSLAALLGSMYTCNIFSMDDFFLRPGQRTPERLNEPGGFIDYERFGEEIVEGLKSGAPFRYRRYDCSTFELYEAGLVEPMPLNVIEGVYSLHQRFIGIYDIKVFLRLDGSAQRGRLAERGEYLLDKFISEWLPMENKYFDYFNIVDKCDFVFDTGD